MDLVVFPALDRPIADRGEYLAVRRNVFDGRQCDGCMPGDDAALASGMQAILKLHSRCTKSS
jgi:hypothetical protein